MAKLQYNLEKVAQALPHECLSAVENHKTFLSVLNWAREMELGAPTVLHMDEFSIDAVFKIQKSLYLVYGMT
ncbi:hypothetical protein [Acanthopleuribacter pedis]|uniref:Uncharacterized protein n=1 Tax=Acanthopleuribacter pedis TaxID=442870 RepID=A0A8J7Q8T5_9BACT|nr:hypothetical protein [Acanthopleuribacter pedis]MBO1319842.1 hypothetical protein [Acanthopleuribacter pedis]